MPKVTVLTATFNRAHTLAVVWASLRAQTFRSFEWVVVDDGSSDATPALVSGWARDSDVAVRYLRQENRGKHVALNRGVAASSGSLVVILDSDDECVPRALERLVFHWESIPASRRAGYYAVVCHCSDERGRLVGDPFPAPVVDARGLDARYLWGVSGEKWGAVRSDLMRAHPFPEELDRTYLPESVVWDRLGLAYKARFVDEPLRIYHSAPPGESLGTPGDPARNARGGLLQHQIVLNEQLEYFRAAPATFLAAAAQYVRFSTHAGLSARRQRAELTSWGARALWWAAAPAGWGAWMIDRTRARGRA